MPLNKLIPLVLGCVLASVLTSSVAVRCNATQAVGTARRFGINPAPGLGQVNTDSTNFSGNGKSATPLKLVGGKGNTGQFTTNSFGLEATTYSGTLASGEVVFYYGDPNTHITADKGSFCIDVNTPAIWQNTTGAAVWNQLGTVGAGSIGPTQLANTAVIAGSYTATDLTVDAQGRITAAASNTSLTTTINALGYGWFGNGGDGSPSYDGSTTVLGMAPSSSVYTLTRDVYLDSPSCSSGVTIKTAGFRIFVKTDFAGPASGTCTLSDKGNNAVTNTAGSGGRGGSCAGGPGLLAGGASGGAGSTTFSGGGNGVASISAACAPNLAGNGGKGGSDPGVANGGVAHTTTCASFPSTQGNLGNISQAMEGRQITTCGNATGGSGGSGGGRNNTGSGISGGGGAGGGYIVVSAKHFTNPSNVTITAAGGDGAAASSCSGGNSSGGGGGGGGGYAFLVLGYGTAPTVTAAGGSQGAGCGATGTAGDPGTNGIATTFRMN